MNGKLDSIIQIVIFMSIINLLGFLNPVMAIVNEVTDPLNVSDKTIQDAADGLLFMLTPPGNCLAVPNDVEEDMASKNLAALWIRAVFHDGAAYDKSETAENNGGSLDGSLTNELNRTEDNEGFGNSLADRFMGLTIVGSNVLSSGDAIALAGLISVSHCGGPKNIPFRHGRVNVSPRDGVNAEGRIPAGDDSLEVVAAHFDRMGLTRAEMVTLTTGSHSMGGVHARNSPNITTEEFVPFDDTPGVFDNDVFKKVLSGYCALPIDCFFTNDPELKALMQKYADDEQFFFDEYAKAFAKFIDLSWSPLSDPIDINVPTHSNLVQEGTTNKGSSRQESSSKSILHGNSNCVFKNVLNNLGSGLISSSASGAAILIALLGLN